MKKSIKHHEETSCIRELDQLVWQEFNALSRKPQPPRPKDVRKHQSPPTDLRTEVIELHEKHLHPQGPAKPQPQPAYQESDDPDFALFLGETIDASDLADDLAPAETTFLNQFMQESLSGQDELFTKEEEEFVDQAVRWLSGQDNKDVIVARIANGRCLLT